MGVVISIPRRLYEEARKRGIDVESKIVEILARELGLDPESEASIRLELAEKYLREAKKLLDKGDTVQASEKLYKVAEETIKAMASALGLPEAKEANERGRWTLRLFDSAAARLAETIDRRIYDDWDHAYFLHVEGFHEARIDVERVRCRLRYVEELLSIARRVLGEKQCS
jgi:CHAD domain-containing protein